jgi:hypothetical protein
MSLHPAKFSIVHKDRQREETSFVGIRRNGAGEQSFVLPPGFDNFPASDDATVSEYFFKLFRTLRQFRLYAEEHDRDEESDFAGDGGIRISAKETEPAMLYSKIQMLEEVLERYDELRIYNVLYRNRRTEDIDYSQIHRYLDKAVYQNDVPYVDEMRLSRPIVEMGVSDLVRMFCFIYTEVSVRTGHERSPEVEAEANRFKAEHLAPDSALFENIDAHNRTVDRLKKKLDDIDRETTYKDEDYWYFFEAVEEFLYGELDEEDDGISWGITRFAPVWEDMCMVWLYKNQWDEVMYADSVRYANDQIGGHDLYTDESFDPPFAFELDGHERYLRPDIVRKIDQSPHNLFNVEGGPIFRVIAKKENENTRIILKGVKRKIERETSGKIARGGEKKWSSEFIGVGKMWVKRYIEEAANEIGYEGGLVFRVSDFKCVPTHLYGPDNMNNKSYNDQRKQITYEYALQLDGVDKTESKLCVPMYYDDPVDDIRNKVDERELHSRFRDQGIDVLRVDFDQVLEGYLEYGNTESIRA